METTFSQTTSGNNTGITSDQHQAFVEWYKQFNVGILTNKDGSFTVLVGDHVKLVKLDRA
jgi:hypothetical protein